MSLSFSERAALGLLSLWPAADLVTLQYADWRFADAVWRIEGSSLVSLVAVQILVLLVWMALTVYYVRHALANKQLSSGEQVGWTVGLALLGPLSMPVYWSLHVWMGVGHAQPVGERVSA